MADKIAEPSEEAEVTAEDLDTDVEDLSDDIPDSTDDGSDSESEDESESEAEETPAEEEEVAETAAKPETADISKIQQRLDDQETELAALRTSNEMLRQRAEQKPAEKKEEEAAFDVEAFNKALAKNPGQAIYELLEKQKKQLLSTTETKTEEVVSERKAFETDKERTLAEFPDLITDKLFNETTIAIYNGLVQTFGRKVPGLLNMAASTAWAKLAKSGKLKMNMEAEKTPKEKEKADAGTKLRVLPKPKTAMPKAATSDDGEEAPEVDWTEFSEKEQALIKKNCKAWGLPIKDYMKQFKAQRKDNVAYGRRG